MGKKRKLVHGVGINDVGYKVYVKETTEERYPNGERKRGTTWRCPYYVRWKSMLERCYSEKYLERKPTYRGCYVCEEWKYFSNFRKWMGSQDWEGKQLDKDLLVGGNKKYSPSACVFIHQSINSFLTDSGRSRGEHLLGCNWNETRGMFQSSIRDPFKKKSIYLGTYDTELDAHLVWKKQKHKFACQLADSEYVIDERVANALRERYK